MSQRILQHLISKTHVDTYVEHQHFCILIDVALPKWVTAVLIVPWRKCWRNGVGLYGGV